MEINTRKTASILYLGKVEIVELANRIKQLDNKDWDTEEDYNANYNKRPNTVLNNTSHIIFRFSNKQKTPFEYFNCSRWEEWKGILVPIIKNSTKSYGYKNGVATRIMLAKLPPKKFIAPHTDGTSNGSIPHKIHIPIETNSDAYFFVNEEKTHLEKGKGYEVNNSEMHSAMNAGNTDRIHLIFEYLDFEAQSELIKNQIDQLNA